MPMVTQSLTAGTWYEFVDLDDSSLIQFYLDSTDVVIAAFESSTPDASSPGFLCTTGMNSFQIPVGKSCWVKLDSGTADVTYSQFGGILIHLQKCALAKSDTVTIDEVVTNVYPQAGFDDTPANQINYVGLLHTVAAGIASTATIDAASMLLQFAQFKSGRTIRVYGIESSTSITSGLTDYDSLAVDPTLTTAYVDVTLDSSGEATVDVAAILQELLDDVAGWSTSSPVQFRISDIDSVPSSGLDESHIILAAGRAAALYVRTS